MKKFIISMNITDTLKVGNVNKVLEVYRSADEMDTQIGYDLIEVEVENGSPIIQTIRGEIYEASKVDKDNFVLEWMPVI